MLDEKFQKVENEYQRLKQMVNARSLSADQFDAAMKELMIEHGGRYWMIGSQSGKWYSHDGQTWLEAEPPSANEVNQPSLAGATQSFDVILKRYDEINKVTVIKVVREARIATGEDSGLKVVKTLIESAPTVVCERVSSENANEIKRALERAGGTVEIKQRS